MTDVDEPKVRYERIIIQSGIPMSPPKMQSCMTSLNPMSGETLAALRANQMGWDAGGVTLDPAIAAHLKRTEDGLVAAIVQSYDTGEVLMLAWMNDEALARTLATGRATYFSRSRREIWIKGETSGHAQRVRSVALDCDGDALLVRVDQEGPVCHTGTATCFTNRELPVSPTTITT